MTWPELSGLLSALAVLFGTFGRGIVWLVQHQSRKTITAVTTERDTLRRSLTRKSRRHRLRPRPPRRHLP